LGEINGCTTVLGIELPSRTRRKVNTNDVVISSMEGSLDSCAMVTEGYNNSLGSIGFYIINPKKINSIRATVRSCQTCGITGH